MLFLNGGWRYLAIGRWLGVAPRILVFVLSEERGTSESKDLWGRRSRRVRLLNYVIDFKLSYSFIWVSECTQS